jgi:phosphoglycolate phosphatase
VSVHVLFDFDGTLVDSSAGVLASLVRAYESCGRQPSVELSSRLIGPPLRKMIEMTCGSPDPAILGRVEAAFRQDYDTRGYLQTEPYAGIGAALRALTGAGRRLHIVTNKRLGPTQQILQHLGWSEYFVAVSAGDSLPHAPPKTQRVAQLLASLEQTAHCSHLIGDTIDDARAARDNGLQFGWARWGYGQDVELPQLGTALADADHMVRYILAAS